jgi:iron-sulfur cluster assembly accessory protein
VLKLSLTAKATSAIRRLIENDNSGALGLRVMVEQGGCSGLQYMLGIETEAGAGDEIYDFDGVKVSSIRRVCRSSTACGSTLSKACRSPASSSTTRRPQMSVLVAVPSPLEGARR